MRVGVGVKYVRIYIYVHVCACACVRAGACVCGRAMFAHPDLRRGDGRVEPRNRRCVAVISPMGHRFPAGLGRDVACIFTLLCHPRDRGVRFLPILLWLRLMVEVLPSIKPGIVVMTAHVDAVLCFRCSR